MTEQHTDSNGDSEATTVQERRRHSRHQFTAAVEAVDTASQTRIQGRTSDLSRGGGYVDAISSFPVGAIVRMRLTKESRTAELDAQVVYSLNGMGMGFRFTGSNIEQLKTIENWVKVQTGSMPIESELIQSVESQPAPVTSSPNDGQVLMELLTELMRQGVLPSTKCEAMLRKLNRPASSGKSKTRV